MRMHPAIATTAADPLAPSAVFLRKNSLGSTSNRGPPGRGPALDGVATRLTRDQLIRQVLQGGGNMPAYAKNLTPAEVNALVAFLESLRPANQSPARASVTPRPATR